MKIQFLPVPRHIQETGAILPATVLQQCNSTFDSSLRPQGYRLTISASGVAITAADPAGEFYAKCTLDQIASQCPETVPEMTIDDYPSILQRGLSLDMSRDKIPTLETLKQLLDAAARLKLNSVMLYFEHVYAYTGDEDVWGDATPFTAAEILELKDFCAARFMNMHPNQESFGHLHKWLRVDKYRPLAECPEGCPSSFTFDPTDPFTLCPTDERSIQFVDRLWGELIANFDSPWICGACDETADLGTGRSKAECDKRGVGSVYLDFIKKLDVLAREKHGKRLVIDYDILLHYPELVPQVPRSLILCDWGYRPDYDFDAHCKFLQDLGFDFIIKPSNSNYTCFNGRTYRYRENIAKAAKAAIKYNALGIYNTEWGDKGHWNEPITALPGDAYFAAVCWCPETNENADLAAALDAFFFNNVSGTADLLLDCGRVYRHAVEDNDSDILWLFAENQRYNLNVEEIKNAITHDNLFAIRTDLQALLFRLEKAQGFQPRDKAVLTVHARWMQLAAEVAEECLRTGAKSGRELPAEIRQKYIPAMLEIRQELIALRDDGTYRTGSRAEAIHWLNLSCQNLCGYYPEEK